MKQPKKISEKIIIDNGWWKVIQSYRIDSKGKKGDVITMKKSKGKSEHSVMILPITEKGEILYLKEFRYGREKFMLNFPSGGIDDSDTPEDAAKKELLEETGYKPKKLIRLGTFGEYAYISGEITLFVATGCKEINTQSTHELEEIEVLKSSKKNFKKLVENNELDCAMSNLCYLLAQKNGFLKKI